MGRLHNAFFPNVAKTTRQRRKPRVLPIPSLTPVQGSDHTQCAMVSRDQWGPVYNCKENPDAHHQPVQ